MPRSSALLLLVALLLAAWPPVAAGAAPGAAVPAGGACVAAPVDLVLVLDDSGSMREGDGPDGRPADPDHLRGTAALLALDLLAPGDRAGVVVFSSGVVGQAGLLPADTGGAELRAAVRLQSRGSTDLAGALEAAVAMLAPPGSTVAPGQRRQAILLLTDGQPRVTETGDFGRPDQERRLLAAARQAGQAGVRLYPVGLGAAADTALLQRLARESGSPLVRALSAAEQLPDAFMEILLDLRGAHSLRLLPGAALETLPATRRLTLVALRPAGARALQGVTGLPEPPPAPLARSAPDLAFGYDLLRLEAPGARRLTVEAGPGALLWAVEELALDARVEAPVERAVVAAGLPVPVAVTVRPAACPGAAADGAPGAGSGAPLLPGISGSVEVLQADRTPAGAPSPLQADGTGALAGAVTLPGAGEFALRVRVAYAGREVGVREVTVTAADTERYRLEVAPRAWTLAPLPVAVVYEHNGRQAAAPGPPAVTARHAACGEQALALLPEGAGRWTGQYGACRRAGRVVFTVAEGGAGAAAELVPTPVSAAVAIPPRWSWLDALAGRPAAAVLEVRAPHDLAPGLRPGLAASGPVAVRSVRWAEAPGAATGIYRVEVELEPGPAWHPPWVTGGSLGARLSLTPPAGADLDAAVLDLTLSVGGIWASALRWLFAAVMAALAVRWYSRLAAARRPPR